MTEHVEMFTNSRKSSFEQGLVSARRSYYLSKEDSMRMYAMLKYRVFEPEEKICEFGSIGDKMYVILQGRVHVSFPTEIEVRFNTYWDAF